MDPDFNHPTVYESLLLGISSLKSNVQCKLRLGPTGIRSLASKNLSSHTKLTPACPSRTHLRALAAELANCIRFCARHENRLPLLEA